jgi:hypothetical protein
MRACARAPHLPPGVRCPGRIQQLLPPTPDPAQQLLPAVRCPDRGRQVPLPARNPARRATQTLPALAERACLPHDCGVGTLGRPRCLALALVLSCSCSDRQSEAPNPSEETRPILIGSSDSAFALAADESRAYWADLNDGTIWTADLDGTEQRELAFDQAQVLDIEADAGDVFWVKYDPTLVGSGADASLAEPVTVTRLAAGSSAPEELYITEGYPGGLTLGSDQVVLVMTRTDRETPNSGEVVAIPRRGGAATRLASELPFPTTPAVRESTVYWANRGSAVDFGRYEDGSIQAMSLSGGSSTTLAAGIATISAFAVGGRLYLSSVVEMEATLFSCPLTGCGEGNADATVVVSRTMEEETGPWWFVADQRGLRLCEYYEPAADILWIAAEGAEPIVLVPARDCLHEIALGSRSVVWVEGCEDASEATIWRMAR